MEKVLQSKMYKIEKAAGGLQECPYIFLFQLVSRFAFCRACGLGSTQLGGQQLRPQWVRRDLPNDSGEGGHPIRVRHWSAIVEDKN